MENLKWYERIGGKLLYGVEEGVPIYGASVESYIDKESGKEIVRLWSSSKKEDRLKAIALLINSDGGYDINLNPRTEIDIVNEEIAKIKSKALKTEVLPKLSELQKRLKTLKKDLRSSGMPLKSEIFSLKGKDARGTISTNANEDVFRALFGDIQDINRLASEDPKLKNTELTRAITSLLNQGLSPMDIGVKAIDETNRLIEFIADSIRKTDKNGNIYYDLNKISYRGGSGLDRLWVDDKTEIIDPDLAPIVRTPLRFISEAIGYKKDTGNVVYDRYGSRFILQGQTKKVKDSREVVGDIVSDPSYIKKIKKSDDEPRSSSSSGRIFGR